MLIKIEDSKVLKVMRSDQRRTVRCLSKFAWSVCSVFCRGVDKIFNLIRFIYRTVFLLRFILLD